MKHILNFRSFFNLVILACFSLAVMHASGQTQEPFDRLGHEQIVRYLQEFKIVEDLEKVTLWTTPFALDCTYIARPMIREKGKDIPFPSGKSWLVMIDDNPEANFGHPVRWIFINAQFTRHSEVMKQDFPPIVLPDFGKGEAVMFKCWDLTPRKCFTDEIAVPVKLKPSRIWNCRYAILVSGGINSGSNYGRYPQNLRSMYTMLRNAGYPKSHIYVYYADGNTDLDCDNEDGDNNDATGSDVTDGAIEASIRAKFQALCTSSASKCGVLFSYFTNHGADDDGVCLWDLNNNGLENSELYSPAELAGDCANSKFCRHFMIHDQCFAGDFLAMAGDGNHDNTVVYAAASATQVSWGRQYMARWEQNDITNTTVNDMHQDVVANGNLTSTPGMAEGTAGVGDHLAGNCCCCWWWKYWYVVIIVVVIGAGVIVIYWRRRKRKQ